MFLVQIFRFHTFRKLFAVILFMECKIIKTWNASVWSSRNSISLWEKETSKFFEQNVV